MCEGKKMMSRDTTVKQDESENLPKKWKFIVKIFSR